VQKKEELEREYAEARRSQQLYEQEINKVRPPPRQLGSAQAD
jgi:hypothetical protein